MSDQAALTPDELNRARVTRSRRRGTLLQFTIRDPALQAKWDDLVRAATRRNQLATKSDVFNELLRQAPAPPKK